MNLLQRGPLKTTSRAAGWAALLYIDKSLPCVYQVPL